MTDCLCRRGIQLLPPETHDVKRLSHLHGADGKLETRGEEKLAAPWGAVIWLTSVVSMAVVEVFFPQVYGGSMYIVLAEATLLGVYLWLAIFAARERPA